MPKTKKSELREKLSAEARKAAMERAGMMQDFQDRAFLHHVLMDENPEFLQAVVEAQTGGIGIVSSHTSYASTPDDLLLLGVMAKYATLSGVNFLLIADQEAENIDG